MPGMGDGLTGPWDTAAPLGRHLRRAARAGIDRTVIFAAFHSDYASANRDVARMVASRPDRLYGFAFVQRRARSRKGPRARPRRGAATTGSSASRFTATMRASRAKCARSRARSRLPVLYDVMGDIVRRRAPGAGIPRCRLHHPAPRELRRRLARAARADRSPRAASQHLRRHGGRPPLRSARAGGAARRRAQDPVRLRWPLAASGGRAREDTRAGAVAGRRSAGDRRRTSCA